MEGKFTEFDKKCLGLESRTEPLSGCINNLRNHAQLHTVTSRTVKKWQTQVPTYVHTDHTVHL